MLEIELTQQLFAMGGEVIDERSDGSRSQNERMLLAMGKQDTSAESGDGRPLRCVRTHMPSTARNRNLF